MTDSQYIQTIISLYDGTSYDRLNINSKYSSSIYTTSVNFKSINELNDSLFKNSHHFRDKCQFEKLKEVITKTTFENTTINFECCSGCYHKGHEFTFGDTEEKQKKSWEFIHNCMMNSLKLVFSDFSLKAFIQMWNKYADKNVYGQIPIKQTGTTEGYIKVVGHQDNLDDCSLFQLKHAGQLSRKSNGFYYLGVHTLSQNIVYQLSNFDIDFEIVERETLKNTINVFSYWYPDVPEFKEKFINDIPKEKLLPCHAEITVHGLTGKILISQCHLSELTKIDPDYKVVAQQYATAKGISYEEALLVPQPIMAQYTQTEVTTAPPVSIPKMQTY